MKSVVGCEDMASSMLDGHAVVNTLFPFPDLFCVSAKNAFQALG
jgi:hypothetical protein